MKQTGCSWETFSRQAALVLPFLPRWDWIGLELRPGCGGLVLNWWLVVGTVPDRSCVCVRDGACGPFFFFLTRDNPPAVRSCSVARFACSRPASSQLSGGVSILSTVNGRRLGSRYSARRVDPTRRERRGGRGEEWKLKAAKEYTGPGH